MDNLYGGDDDDDDDIDDGPPVHWDSDPETEINKVEKEEVSGETTITEEAATLSSGINTSTTTSTTATTMLQWSQVLVHDVFFGVHDETMVVEMSSTDDSDDDNADESNNGDGIVSIAIDESSLSSPGSTMTTLHYLLQLWILPILTMLVVAGPVVYQMMTYIVEMEQEQLQQQQQQQLQSIEDSVSWWEWLTHWSWFS
jgi:hypothetical protein